MANKLTESEFITRSNHIHNNRYDYNNVYYINSQQKVIILCREHGKFSQKPNNHLNGRGCPKCFGTKKKNISDFISEANKAHNHKYSYSKVNYKNNSTKVEIICYEHGSFFQTPKNHLHNRGCAKCCGKKVFNIKDFIYESNKVHKNKYNYIKTNYTNSSTKVEIVCSKHGSFFQKPNSHLNGQGCLKCSGSEKMTNRTFIVKANKIHNNKYNYNFINYINNKKKINIICNKHGSFFQRPNCHLSGHGCPKCTNNFSKKEYKWLNSLNIKYENRQISLPGLHNKIKVDGYNPNTNTVYEFYGDYWHGYPFKDLGINKTVGLSFNTLYYKTIEREEKIRNLGYNLIAIWESDFKKCKKEN